MALSFFQKARDSDRLICLTYPYRPLLESYVCPKKEEILIITYLSCYKSVVNSWTYYDYEKLWDFFHVRSNLEAIVFNKNLKFVQNFFLSLLREFNCEDNEKVSMILGLYYHMKRNLGPLSLGSANKTSEEKEPSASENKRDEQTLRSIYIYNSIDGSDVKYLQMMLRYGYQCLATEEEYSVAMATSRKFA